MEKPVPKRSLASARQLQAPLGALRRVCLLHQHGTRCRVCCHRLAGRRDGFPTRHIPWRAERAGFSRGCTGAGGLGAAGVTLLTNRLPFPPSPSRSPFRGGSGT